MAMVVWVTRLSLPASYFNVTFSTIMVFRLWVQGNFSCQETVVFTFFILHQQRTVAVQVYGPARKNTLQGADGYPVSQGDVMFFPGVYNAQGGLQIILGPTGGFLWGFILGTYFMGKFVENRDSYPALLGGMFICLLTCYTLGTLQLVYITGLHLQQALLLGVLPFIPLDLVKLFAAAQLSFVVKRRLARAGLLPATARK
jgi:hypothetical protein